MKVVIAGSRTIRIGFRGIEAVLELLKTKITLNPDYDEIVAGGCPTGPDVAAKLFATQYGFVYTEFPADWDQYGKFAGPRRNRQMAEYGDVLILIWDGQSRGSLSMKNEMMNQGKPVYEFIIRSTEPTYDDAA